MKRLKVKGKDYYIRKTDVSLILENHICNASFFNDVEVTFLCSMFDYEIVREESKKYVIKNFKGYFLTVRDDLALSYTFCATIKNAFTFETKDDADCVLKSLQISFGNFENAEVVEFVEI